MKTVISHNMETVKSYVMDNASSFGFIALFKVLLKLGYDVEKINFFPSESLKSQKAFIESVRFKDDYVEVHINDLNSAIFLNVLKESGHYDYKLEYFFISLISKLLFEYTTSVYLEGRKYINFYFDNGNALVSVDDVNLRSYAFIYSFIGHLFSNYNLSISKTLETVKRNNSNCILGDCYLESDLRLGDIIEEEKEFLLIRFITESFIDRCELSEIDNRLCIFERYFWEILDSICIILENQITDESLYTSLPLTLSHHTVLIQDIVRLNKKVIK